MAIVTPNMMLNRLRAYNVSSEAVIVLNKGKGLVKDIQREQWEKGIASDNGKLVKRKYSNKAYAEMKQAMNPTPGLGNMDLILTGTTIDSLTFNAAGDIMKFALQNDEHDLIGRFGNRILGFATLGREKFVGSYLQAAMVKSLKDKTGMR